MKEQDSPNSPADSKLAQALRIARAEAGVIQRQIGQALGYHPTVICSFENGRRKPDKETLKAWARFYGKPEDFFLCLDAGEDAEATRSAGTDMRTRLVSMLTEVIRSLPTHDLVTVLGTVTQCMDNATANDQLTAKEEQ